jgi:hypothetical protein
LFPHVQRNFTEFLSAFCCLSNNCTADEFLSQPCSPHFFEQENDDESCGKIDALMMINDLNSDGSDDDIIADFEFVRDLMLQRIEEDKLIEEHLIPDILTHVLKHNSSLFRKRWDSQYLRNLAENEGSFLAEYRVDPGGFDLLHEILESSIQRDDRYSAIAMGTSGSAPITTS